MWEIRVDETFLKQLCLKRGLGFAPTLTIRATTIRDGTPGISLAIGDELIGEWTDSRTKSLALTKEHRVVVYGRGGDMLYMVVMPGISLTGEQLSDTEVKVSMQL